MQKRLLPLGLAALLANSVVAQALVSDEMHHGHATPLQRVVEPAGPISLLQALDLAMHANPELAIARREVEARDGAVRQAGAIPNPEFAVLAEDTRRDTRSTTLQLNQPVELGGKRSARIAAAERSREAALMELSAKRADMHANVVSAFYDVLHAQERLQLALAAADLAQRATTIAAKRVAAGKISPVEETRSRVAEAGVRVDLAQAASDLANARRRLAATWGGVSPRFERAHGDIATMPAVPPLATLTARLEQSPNLMLARAEVARRQALTQIERARQTPDVTVSIGAKRDEQLGRNQAIVGVSIPLPLFDRNQGNLQEALSRTDKARDELAATEIRLTNDLGQAYERFHAARQEAELLQRDVLPGAQGAYDAATKGFEFGKFSFLDVLDAQRTLFQAKSQYVRVLSEAHRTAAEIDRILGAVPMQEKK
jgi:cobalt-zinc-cadmium efflux system outer membrane protein